MPIHGTIEEAGLPDVLQLLALGGKTGCLSVSDTERHGQIFLEAGRVSYAEVASRREHFADKLVKRGRITMEQLELARFEQSTTSRPLGHVLVDSGMVERSEMEKLLRTQVEEAIYLLFEWKQGQFTFTSNQRPPYKGFAISLDPENLLLEGARRVDEWELIKKKIPSFDLVYRRSGSSLNIAAADLTESQKKILPLLDGTRDVSGIVELSGLGEFEAVKALYGLLMAGFAQLLERRSRVRHLEYREILAYIVREAEFAEGDRRKDAARHIADCPTCARRLRSIHVRRTEGSGIPAVVDSDAVEVTELPVTAEPEVAQAVMDVAAVVGAAAALTLHVQDRRMAAAGDRRAVERRAGADRRVTVTANWSQHNVERRQGSRRAGERRNPAGSRRTGEIRRGPAAPRTPGTRETVPRQAVTERRGPHGRPQFAVPVPNDNTAPAAAAPAAQAPAASAAPAVTPVAPPTPPPPEIRPARRSSGQRRGRASRTATPSNDIVWITTPEESLELVRKRNSELKARESARHQPPPPAAASAPVAAPAPAPAPKPISAPVAEVLAASLPAPRPWPARRLTLSAVAGIVIAAGLGAGALLLNTSAPAPSSLALRPAPTTAPAAAPALRPVSPPAIEQKAIEPQSVTTHPTETPAVPAPVATAPSAAVPSALPAAAAAAISRPTRDSAKAVAPTVRAPAPAPAPAPAAEETATAAWEPDNELGAGGWLPIERAEAVAALGGTMATIPGLRIESITTSSAGGRPRIRVAQMARTGQRIVLVQMNTGSGAPSTGRVRPTALSVSPPETEGGNAIGTANLGGLFITAKSHLPVDDLRAALQRLAETRN